MMTTWTCATCGPVPAGEIRHLDHNSPHGHETCECGSSAELDWTKTKEHEMSAYLTCQQIYSASAPEQPAIIGVELERYCVDSGRAVSMTPGDRCIKHGAADQMCTTDVRPAQCQHPHLSPNHPHPHCSECGKDVTAS